MFNTRVEEGKRAAFKGCETVAEILGKAGLLPECCQDKTSIKERHLQLGFLLKPSYRPFDRDFGVLKLKLRTVILNPNFGSFLDYV